MCPPHTSVGVVANRRRPSSISPTLASNAWHWLGLRYFWLLHGFLPALRPNGGSCPEIPGAACGEVSSNGRRASRQACTGRPAVIWGPPQNFRELRKKRPRRNYTSAVFAYYWRLETRQGAGERAGLQIKGDKTREKLAESNLFGLEWYFCGHSWPEALESKSSGAVVFKLDFCDNLILAIQSINSYQKH